MQTRATFLVGVSGKHNGEILPVTGPQFVLGRDSSKCDLAVDNASVSRRHAMIRLEPDGSATITDLDSSYGTYLNGRAVKQAPLKDGDRISVVSNDAVAFTFRVTDGPLPTIDSRPRPASKTVAAPPAHPADADPPKALPKVQNEIRIGRLSSNDIVLSGAGVSRNHALLRYAGDDAPTLIDLGTTNGTFVNGEPVSEPRRLRSEDLVFIAGYLIKVVGEHVRVQDLSSSSLNAVDICQQFGAKRILQDVSMAINPREFVGLMGPSGCGKSTLLDALSGLRPASSGEVLVDAVDLYQNFGTLRRSIGYVPQRDVLHESLTVDRTLYYAAKMRLPEGTPAASRAQIVSEVIASVGLTQQRGTQFRRLSGGQRKRLSLALELITKPSFLFLDEPTSPLDPETTENMMTMFRRLADEGRIVVMVTHKFEKFFEMHQVAILTGSGQLAFFGPPADALNYFGCDDPNEMYKVISRTDSEALASKFQDSEQCEDYVRSRLRANRDVTVHFPAASQNLMASAGASEQRFGIRQWMTLSRRYLEVKLKDRLNTALLLLQAPAIAAVLATTAGGAVNDIKTLFIAAVVAIWFGANNAIREIVAEAPIYRRERLLNLKIPSYVLSKFAVLSGIAAVQCALFVSVLTVMERVRAEDFLPLTGILYLTSLSGVALGLLFSGWVGSTEKAMSLLPLLLIPQLLLSGFFKPLQDVPISLANERPVSAETYTASKAAGGRAAASVRKIEGLGSLAYASYPIAARWSFEAVVHWIGGVDPDARHQLASQTYVPAYRYVLEKKTETEIHDRFLWRVIFDLSVLALSAALMLVLTMVALKRKDTL